MPTYFSATSLVSPLGMCAIGTDESTRLLSVCVYEYMDDAYPVYDRDAPTNVGATHTPRSVRILCTLFVTGLTHAASCVSRVVNPGWTVSKIFFLGFSCERGVASVKCGINYRVPLRDNAGRRTLKVGTLEVDTITGLRSCWWLNEFDASFLAIFMCCLWSRVNDTAV